MRDRPVATPTAPPDRRWSRPVLGPVLRQRRATAEAAGDAFATRSSLAVNGISTLAAALFGSCFPTTIYIGHPGWKAMGARAGYSILNGAFMTVVCLTGALAWVVWAVPVDAGMAAAPALRVVKAECGGQALPTGDVQTVLEETRAGRVLHVRVPLRVTAFGSPWVFMLANQGALVEVGE